MIDFTHAGYLRLLNFIRDLGRPAVSFRDIPAEGGYVILRHDIDFSLRCAVEMAYLDKEAGATSTFFVLLTAPYYNAMSQEGICALREIASLGHECGLHYDSTGFEVLSSEQRLKRIDVLACTLEDAIGAPIRAIAQHKPARAAIRQEFPSYVDAYSAQYSRDIAYISDSRRMFRVPDVCEFLRHNARSQALIHPVWWWPEPMTRGAIFDALKEEIAAGSEAMLLSEEAAIEQQVAIHATSSP